MHKILVFVAAFSLPAWGSVCGLYQSEDFGGEVVFTLTEYPPQTLPVQHKITNGGHPDVQTMLRGFCYCVDGESSPDPQFKGDSSYRLLIIEKLRFGPYRSCQMSYR